MDISELIKAVDSPRLKPLATLPTGSEVRAIRERAGVGRTAFAAAARVTSLTLENYEQGKVKQPRPLQEQSFRRVLAAIQAA